MNPSDPDQSSDLANSFNVGAAQKAPWLSISAFLSVPVLTLVSLHFLRASVERQIASSDAPNAGQFGGFAIAVGGVFAATGAALLGLVLTFLGDRRDEPWVGLRIAAWLVNGIVAVPGLFLVLAQLLGGH